MSILISQNIRLPNKFKSKVKISKSKFDRQ